MQTVSFRRIQTAAALCLAASIFAGTAYGGEGDAEFAAGKAEYMYACAACHGDKATGNGPIATMLRVTVPDLTGLSSRHEGKFPFLDVFHTVDGRNKIAAHGNPMPIFGNRYKAEAEQGNAGLGSEERARLRMMDLVFYLQSIQQ